MHTRRVVLIGVLLATTQTGCAWGAGCPDLEWSRTVVVRMADGTAGRGLTAVAVCPDGRRCDGLPSDGAFTEGAARLVLSQPVDEVGVQVLGADEEVVAAVEARLDWVRVGGTEACGGPLEAEVLVPGP